MIAAIYARKTPSKLACARRFSQRFESIVSPSPLKFWSWIIGRHGPNEEFFLARKRRRGA